jgi:hypothetical protein
MLFHQILLVRQADHFSAFFSDRSHMHDHVQGNWTWPSHYDARALVHPSYYDHQAGMGIEENEARYKAANKSGDVSMMVTWSYVLLTLPTIYPSFTSPHGVSLGGD